MSPLSPVSSSTPLSNVFRQALRERVAQAGATNAVATPSPTGGTLVSALSGAGATASLIWHAQAPDKTVPADNTYENLTQFKMSSVSTLVPTDLAAIVRAPAWALQPSGDAISRLMERNPARPTQVNLADQWRGLSGALLARVSAPSTTPVQYQQTFLNSADPTKPLDGQFSRMLQGATTVTLQIKTRSGQTVDLQIAANNQPQPPGSDGSQGLQVSVSSSGPLSDAERRALAALSDGLEEALAGLGNADAPEMNLSGVLQYDRSVFAQLDLDVHNPTSSAAVPLKSFALHLGDQENSLAYESAAGKIDLRLDATAPVQAGNPQQRKAAVAQRLQQIDAAAERSRADSALVALFKSSFTQMHNVTATPSAAGVTAPDMAAPAISPALANDVRPLLSGLADFEAGFSGDFSHANRFGSINERGHAQYEISQQTEVTVDRNLKTADITQTRNERLQAAYVKARNGGALDAASGNFDRYAIQDERTVTTLISAVDGHLASAVRQTDQKQLHVHESLFNHRVQERHETPNQEHLLALLI